MLGWNISVYRLSDDARPRVDDESFHDSLSRARRAKREDRIAVWQAGLHGLDWIERITENGLGHAYPGNGYPNTYIARAGDLIPQILQGPPDENPNWIVGQYDVLGPGWKGKTTIDEEALKSCDPGEWLQVEAWDES